MPTSRARARSLLSRFWHAIARAALTPQGFLFALIVVICIVTTARSQYFLTAANIENIGRQIAVSGILPGGTTLPMLAGMIFLSVRSCTGFVGLVAIKLVLDHGIPFFPALGVAVAIVVLIDAAMGLTIAKTRVPSFMLTLALWTALGGIDLLIQGDFPVV